MKIAIILHSYTGNTRIVMERLKAKLEAKGRDVTLFSLVPIGGENTNEIDITKINFESIADATPFDTIIVAAPVRGFNISPVLKSYLTKMGSLQGKTALCFVTHFFPFAWMGANNAIHQMKELCVAKGAKVVQTGIVHWKRKSREQQIEALIQECTNIL